MQQERGRLCDSPPNIDECLPEKEECQHPQLVCFKRELSARATARAAVFDRLFQPVTTGHTTHRILAVAAVGTRGNRADSRVRRVCRIRRINTPVAAITLPRTG